MENNNLLEFELSGDGLVKYGETLKAIVTEWLNNKNGMDVIVSFFEFEGLGTLNVDCFYCGNELFRAKILTEKLLKKLNIDYEIVKNT